MWNLKQKGVCDDKEGCEMNKKQIEALKSTITFLESTLDDCNPGKDSDTIEWLHEKITILKSIFQRRP